MEAQDVKRVLSQIKPDFNFHFSCWFDKGVDMDKEISEARMHCHVRPNDVFCSMGEWNATIIGGEFHKKDNEKNVSCVRSYLLKHLGWMEGEEP
jgi:hypothetical protein